MANPEHLAILKQGVEQWNKWRRQHPDVEPDLSEANLGGADLHDADFSETVLIEADLNRANLSGANLRKAGLPSANLGGANLQQASLEGAELTYANLTTANLRNADLYAASLQLTMVSGTIFDGASLRCAKFRGTRFAGANLSQADFTNAVVRSAIFSDVDLSGVSGLGEMFHEGPSTIGIDTIYKSHGQIPKVFLRGCGLADWEIEAAKWYDPSLSAADAKDIASRVVSLRASQPFQYYSCFISYSTKDQDFADRLYADLQAKGVRCWFAPHDIHGGRKIHEQIDDAIRLHDKLLLILSEHSMSSNWVKTEIANARQREEQEKKNLLFPITLAAMEEVKKWKLFDADR
jgi:uncharacterized protein YjbI with pentapeptide repeats